MLPILALFLVSAFEYDIPAGGLPALMAGTAVSCPANATAFNPALLGTLPQSAIELVHANPYGIPSLQYNAASFGMRQWAAGTRLSLLSYTGYQELSASVAKSFLLAGRLHLGTELDLYLLSIPAAERLDLVPALTAGLAFAGPWYSLGAAIRNLNHPALRSGEPVPLRVLLGASATPVNGYQLAADYEYSDNAARFRFGVSLTPHPALLLGIGLATNPLEYAGGVGCRYHGLSINYAYRFSPRLKQTQSLGAGFSF